MLAVWIAGLTVDILFIPNTTSRDLELALPIYAVIMTLPALACLILARWLEKSGVGLFAGPAVGALLLLILWAAVPRGNDESFLTFYIPIIISTCLLWGATYLLKSKRPRFGTYR